MGGFMDFPLSTLQIQVLDGKTCEYGPAWSDFSELNDPYGRIYWLDEGRAVVRHHGRRFDLQPGRLYLIPAHTPSRYYCPKQMTLRWIHYTAELLNGLDLTTVYPCCYAVVPPDRRRIESLWDSFFAPQRSAVAGQLARQAVTLQLLSMFLCDIPSGSARLGQLERFRDVLGYIEANLTRPLRLAELAGVMHLQPTYFSNLFTEHLGQSPVQYIHRRRIERARRQLLQTDRAVHEIAASVGFEDPFYFSRLFKRLVGYSPSDFRKRPPVQP
jgi:AraC-like DNA-binding protein